MSLRIVFASEYNSFAMSAETATGKEAHDPYLEGVKREGLIPRSKLLWFVLARHLARESCTRTGKNLVLDLGCNAGYASGWLEHVGIEVVGIDKSKQAVDYGKEHMPGMRFIQADLKSPPWQVDKISPKVGAVLLLDTLEHLQLGDAKSLLQRAHKIASPNNAAVIVSLPILSVYPVLEGSLYTAIHGGQRPEVGVLDRTHMWFMSHKNQRQLFEDYGFAIEKDFSGWGIDTAIENIWEVMKSDDALFANGVITDSGLDKRVLKLRAAKKITRFLPRQFAEAIFTPQRMYELRPHFVI